MANARSRLLPLASAALLVAGTGMLAGGSIAAAQRKPASPAGEAAAQIGGLFDPRSGYVNGGWIEVKFGRPLRRGRDIFGPPDFIAFLNDGAPVWRAGANYTTRLITELPLVIADVRLEPGEYTMFIQLGPERWILIISTWPAQETYDYQEREALFGAYGYTPGKGRAAHRHDASAAADLLRAVVVAVPRRDPGGRPFGTHLGPADGVRAVPGGRPGRRNRSPT